MGAARLYKEGGIVLHNGNSGGKWPKSAQPVTGGSGMDDVNIALTDIIEYQTFRRNPGPIITRATSGRPMLVVKGRKKVVMLDAADYERLVLRATEWERHATPERRTGTEG